MNLRTIVLYLSMAFLAVVIGAGLASMASNNAKIAREQAEITAKLRAQQEKERQEREERKRQEDAAYKERQREVRIKELRDRLQKLKGATSQSFFVRRQFGTDGDNGVFEASIGLRIQCVLITAPDFPIHATGLTPVTRRVLKRGREQFSWETVNRATGVRTVDDIFVDVYVAVSPEEIEDTQKELDRLLSSATP